MSSTIRFQVKTQSNLFIGGAPNAFEIGGIDQYTVTTHEGKPYISASSFKGAFRNIVRELGEPEREKEIADFYLNYIQNEKNKNCNRIKEMFSDKSDREEKLKEINKRYAQGLTIESIFGIEGFNNTPRLLFSDLHLGKEFNDSSKWFSVDAKNSIDKDVSNGKLVSNPRTYKTARSGLTFEGEIRLYKLELLGEGAEELCRKYIISALEKFNEGVHRLGNSKSRGYGKIEVQVIAENEGGKG